MTFILRYWDFDIDSAVLGPIRCARLNSAQKFAEYEEQIRSGSVDSTQLARDVFQTIAHRRTGDDETDNKCRGPMFSEEEVLTLPPVELDLFCDKLIKGSLTPVHAAGEEPAPATASKPGRDGLAPALLGLVEAERAVWERTVKMAEKNVVGAAQLEAKIKADLWNSVGGDAGVRAIQEIQRADEISKAAMGRMSVTDNIAKAAMDLMSPHTSVGSAFQEMQRVDEIAKAVMGRVSVGDDIVQAGLGYSSKGVVFQAMEQMRADEEAGRRFAMGQSIQETGLNGARGGQAPPVPDLAFTPIRMPDIPVNPVHQTNRMMGDLLEHQRSEAKKKDAERSESKVESTEATKIAKSGLFYTKASFWVAFIPFAISSVTGIWAVLSQIEIGKLRAEIRALTEARKHEQNATANLGGTPKTSRQTTTKPKSARSK
jgi:hypothetical protein